LTREPLGGVGRAQVTLLPLATRAVYKVMYRGQLVWIGIEADGEVAAGGGLGYFLGTGAAAAGEGGGVSHGPYGGHGGLRHEVGYVLTAFNWSGGGTALLQRLLADAQQAYERRAEHSVEMYVSRYGSWERVGSRISRKVRPMHVCVLRGESEQMIGPPPAERCCCARACMCRRLAH
jgi:hypothetical protein